MPPPAEVGLAHVAPAGVPVSPPSQWSALSSHIPAAVLGALVTQLQVLGAAILGDDGDTSDPS